MKTPSISRRLMLLACLLAVTIVCPDAATSADGKLESLEEKAFTQATALVGPSVVRVQTVGGLDQVGRVLTGTGPTTGVVVSADGYIISSAFNFISKPASILIQLPDGRRFTAKLVATDRSKMLTLLKIDAKNLPLPQIAPKKSLQVGQWSIALGRTFDGPLPSISIGIISALDRIWGRAVQTDAKISPVNYGGPLVSIEGKVQGILVPLSTRGKGQTAGVEWYDSGIGFAIPMADVMSAVKRLKTGNDLSPGLMGISFKGAGLLGGPPIIDRVRTGSPADKAGFKAKDRIIEIDGNKIERQAGIKRSLGNRYAGDVVTMTVVRDGKSIRKEVTLVEKLIPYESAYLGILPVREMIGDAKKLPGVGIRFVFPGSPAEKAQLKARDRIVKYNGRQITTPQSLLNLVSRQKPNEKAAINYRRGNAEMIATITLASIPNTLPDELLPTIIPPSEKPAGINAPKTGRFTVNMPKFERSYWAFVPEGYNPAYQYGVMVWLHPGGDTMEASMIEMWELLCERWNIVIIAPKAGKLGGWTPNEAEFVKAAIDNFGEKYSIDPSRLFLHSYADSGKFAFQLAFKFRDTVRGVCSAAAPIRTRPGTNSPEFRLQFHFVCGDKDPANKLVTRSVSGLRKLKYPTSSTTVKDMGHEYPGIISLDEIARWADCLDRI